MRDHEEEEKMYYVLTVVWIAVNINGGQVIQTQPTVQAVQYSSQSNCLAAKAAIDARATRGLTVLADCSAQ